MLKSVTPMPGHKVWAVFSDGSKGEADLSGLLDIPYMSKLKDYEFFSTMRLMGGAIFWNYGKDDELDCGWEDIYFQITGKRWTEIAMEGVEPIAMKEAKMIVPPDVYVKFNDGAEGEIRLTDYSYDKAPPNLIADPLDVFISDDGDLVWNGRTFDLNQIYEHLTSDDLN